MDSSFLTTGLLLAGLTGGTPASAAPCTGAANGPNSTQCIGGSSAAPLTYVADNPAYLGGDFTLTLQDHDVTAILAGSAGISLIGVTGGNGTITLNGDSDITVSGFAGISSALTNGVNNMININGTSSVLGTAGISATTAGTGGNITVKTGESTAVIGTMFSGISAVAVNGGDIEVDANGLVTGQASGISAGTTAGKLKVTTGGIVTGNTLSGIFGIVDGPGDIEVIANDAVTGGTAGINVNAVGGSIKVTTAGSITGMGGTGIDAAASNRIEVDASGNVTGTGGIGINANAQRGGVDVTTAEGAAVEGTNGAGIFANASDAGDVLVTANGAVSGSTIGIDANSVVGKVNVTTGTGTILGEGGNGIDATAAGDVTVGTGGKVQGTVNAINAISSASGSVSVVTGRRTAAIIGAGGAGINASAIGAGTVTITNGSTTLGSLAGIVASSAGGAIRIDNNQILANGSLSGGSLVIKTTGGPTAINNNNALIGRVETGASVDNLTNGGSGWATEGVSDFGDGIDAVINNSTLRVANIGAGSGTTETARFLNLEALTNSSVLLLADQAAGDGSNISDVLRTSGNYSGINDASLEVDAFLGGAGSLSDVLIVDGNTSGTTLVVVTDTNAGVGAFNPTGILVVDVGGTSAADDFELANGPIDKGLFAYDLVFDAANGEHRLVGLPDREAFETLAVVASAQEIWRETADAWSARQESLRDLLTGSNRVTAVADPVVEGSTAPSGGLWASGLGSWSKRDDDASFTLLNANLEFDMSYKQEIYGVVGGADFRTDLGDGGSLLFGLMGGYVDSQLDFDEGSTSIDTKGATLGAYAGLLSNGFFATLLVQADLLNMDYTVGSLAADDSDDADVTSIGARGDLGYRFGDAVFLEPMISVDGFSTKIEEFSIGGADIDAGTNESFRGGAGLRAGYGGDTFSASATARVWNVFATDNEVEVLAGVPLGLSDDDLEGVYGDVSGQLDISLSANTTAYLRGGVLFSDDTTKPSASGGFAFYW